MSILSSAESKRAAGYNLSLREALERNQGDVRASARDLGVSREWVRRWCKRLKIDTSTFRKPPRPFSVVLHGKLVGQVTATSLNKATALAVTEYMVQPGDLGHLVVFEQKEE